MLSSYDSFETVDTLIGEVQWYNAAKGFGFLKSPGVEGDILIHQNTIRNFSNMILAEGMKVEFELVMSDKGPRANKVLSVELGSHQNNQVARDVGQTHPARIKWFDENRGYGFANVFGLPDDVYVTADIFAQSGMAPLEGGQAVSLVLETKGDRLRASSLHPW